jgi:hypothetical protein
MRIPAVSFDPPLAAPGGVSPLWAAMAAGRTAVSPDARARSAPHRSPFRGPADEPGPEPDASADVAPAPRQAPAPMPAFFPPLAAQRQVLDRPRESGPVQVSALEATMRQVMGSTHSA